MIENLTRRDVGKLVGAGALVASNMVTTGAIDAAARSATRGAKEPVSGSSAKVTARRLTARCSGLMNCCER